ncbi:MAG: AAA family ATPase [Myxococcota bacterium]
MPVLSRITIENFQCIEKVTVDLPDFGALVGANDSGKSSFLRAIGMIGRALGQSGENVLNGPDSLQEMARRDGSHRHTVVLEAHSRPDDKALSYVLKVPPAAPGLFEETVELEGQPTAAFRHMKLTLGTAQLGEGQFSPTILYAYPARFAAHLNATRPLASASILRLSPTTICADASHRSLNLDGSGLACVLAGFALTSRPTILAIENELRRLTEGRVASIATPDNGQGSYSLWFVMASGEQIPARFVSTGLLYLLYVLALVHSDNPPRIILIEEPENGVHPGRLKEMVALLRRLTQPEGTRPACQILMATHSPYLLDEFTPGEVLVFRRDGAGGWTTIRRPPLDLVKRGWGLHLGELWGSFGERGLIEGPTPAEAPTIQHDS